MNQIATFFAKITGDNSGLVKAIDQSKRKLNELKGSTENIAKMQTNYWKGVNAEFSKYSIIAAGAVGAIGAVGAAAYKMAVGFSEYALEVDNFSRMIGISAEESSRLIQVAGDVQLSSESMQTALKYAVSHGVDVSIDGLKRLSDEYIAIKDPLERTQYAMTMFGQSAGPEMSKLLELGGTGIEQYSQKVKNVITQEDIDKAKKFKEAQDNINDSMLQLKNTVAIALTPAVTGLLTTLNLFIESVFDRGALDKRFADLTIATYDAATSADQYAESLRNSSWEEYGGIVLATNEQLREQYDSLSKLDEILKKYNITLYDAIGMSKDQLDTIIRTKEQGWAMEEMYRNAYGAVTNWVDANGDGITTIDEAKDAIDRMQGSYEGLATSIEESNTAYSKVTGYFRELTNQMIFQAAAAGLDKDAMLALAVQMGLLNQETYDAMTEVEQLNQTFTDGLISLPTYLYTLETIKNTIDLLSGKDVYVNIYTTEFFRRINGTWGPGQPTGASVQSGFYKTEEEKQKQPYASGGSFQIPSSYGYEGFRMGDLATASGGETVTVTPAGQSPTAELSQRSIIELRQALKDAVLEAKG